MSKPINTARLEAKHARFLVELLERHARNRPLLYSAAYARGLLDQLKSVYPRVMEREEDTDPFAGLK